MTDSLDRYLFIPRKNLHALKTDPFKRIFGALVDMAVELIVIVAILITVFSIIGFDFENIEELDRAVYIGFTVYQVVSFLLALVVPTLTKGKTVGKILMGTRIIRYDGNRGNLIVFLVRQSFFTLISLIGQIDILYDLAQTLYFLAMFACVIMLFSDSLGRTFQDQFANTMVVDDQLYLTYRERAFHKLDNPHLYIVEEEDVLEDQIEEINESNEEEQPITQESTQTDDNPLN